MASGREHWTNVMSMVLAGGGLRHGQVIGATDRRGYDIADRKVTPQDLAATVFHDRLIAIAKTKHDTRKEVSRPPDHPYRKTVSWRQASRPMLVPASYSCTDFRSSRTAGEK